MSAATPADVCRSTFARLRDWLHARPWSDTGAADLAGFGNDELAHLANDVGVPVSELRELATHGPDTANLLDRRLAALHVDRSALAKTDPAMMRDLERLCTLCRAKGRCARDLAEDPDDPCWRQYCPNVDTLDSLAKK